MSLTNPCLTKKLGLTLALASASNWAFAAMIYIETDTFLKSSTEQASALPAASKCAVTKGRGIEISGISEGGADHFRVTLPRTYPGCALTTAFVYKPHMSTDSTAITTYAPTVFKKTTASASTLPATSKCDMPIGVYGSSSTVAPEAGHFKVNLKTLMPGCSFSLGYVFDGHAAAKINVLSLTDSVWLKKSTADSSTLPSTDKCLIAKADYLLTKAPVANGTHWQVNLAKTPSGCSFNTGYVYYELSYLANPSGGGGDLGYTVPLKNGFKGSAWCICRSVGTSPHIGQDWNADGTETSVAIANGVVANKGFDSACGHSVTLRDDSGAEWIYRHLNSNALTVNQRVTKGQTLGNHSAYPTSGCGTGPHLHIERRSAGGFGDSAVFKSCEAGPEPCYFDPNKPFAARAALVDQSDELQVHTEVAELPDSAPNACRANPAGYPEVQASELTQYSDAGKTLTAAVRLHTQDGQQQIELAAAVSGNAENRCDGQNCLTAMSLVAEQLDGTLRRVFHHSTLKNQPAALLAEEEHCLPVNASGKLYLLVKDKSGARFRQELSAK